MRAGMNVEQDTGVRPRARMNADLQADYEALKNVDLWRGLKYWKSGEWQVVEEALHLIDQENAPWDNTWAPGWYDLFKPLLMTPMQDVKVVILGQDPYPDAVMATGLAFDIGKSPVYPPTMRAIIKELKDDVDVIHTGNLKGWAEQGVLLWNCIPSNNGNTSLSHNWVEYEPLTAEILQETSKRNIVFVALGGFAKKYLKYVNQELSDVHWWNHPAARPIGKGAHIGEAGIRPFLGSRMFSIINANLVELGHQPIDWRL